MNGEEVWGPCKHYARMYDKHSVETQTGEVVSVEEYRPIEGISCGIQIMLKTDKEIVIIHLGPAWYVDAQDVKIVRGDRVEVKGSRVNFEGKPVLMAAEVKELDPSSNGRLSHLGENY